MMRAYVERQLNAAIDMYSYKIFLPNDLFGMA